MHWAAALPATTLLVLFFIMWWAGKFPSIETIHNLAELANTKGGIILLLYTMTFVYFLASVRFGYWVISRSSDGKVSTENALVLALFSFITGSAFGGSASAMYKTMTGDSIVTRNGGENGKTQTETTTVTSTVIPTASSSSVPTPSGAPGSDQPH